MVDTDQAKGMGTRTAENNHRTTGLSLPWTEAAQNKINSISRRAGRKNAEVVRDVCERVSQAMGYDIVPVVLVVESAKMVGALLGASAVVDSE